MNITEHDFCPDSTYFRGGDVEPDVKEDGLHIYSGRGSRRGWGTPGNTSFVIYNDDNLTSIFVGFYHKHGGGQFWRHYRNGQRVMWRGLDDGERMLILDAYATDAAPGFADPPGKLKRDYLKPKELQRLEIDEQGTIYGYKYLSLVDGVFHSPMVGFGGAAWENGELEADQEPTENNSNGVYCMKSRKSPVLSRYARENCYLVRLALSGTVVEANEGMRAQHALIVEVLS